MSDRSDGVDREDDEAPVAEPEEMIGGLPRAALVVDLDRRLAGQGRRVDEDHRQAGPADLLDLRMVRRQADGDDPVDGRPVDRAGQRAVERRDEVEGVAGRLGRAGDAGA